MKKKLAIITLVIFLLAFLIPEQRTLPVKGATRNDWNSKTFWFEPWGTSGVHKGIDIFAKDGTEVIAATNQIILYRGELKKGGIVILALGPKWRLHYYAHLKNIHNHNAFYIQAGDQIATVGDTGNAKGKAPHLHYSIVSLLPIPWLIDSSSQGYKKAFYLNPIKYFEHDAL